MAALVSFQEHFIEPASDCNSVTVATTSENNYEVIQMEKHKFESNLDLLTVVILNELTKNGGKDTFNGLARTLGQVKQDSNVILITDADDQDHHDINQLKTVLSEFKGHVFVVVISDDLKKTRFDHLKTQCRGQVSVYYCPSSSLGIHNRMALLREPMAQVHVQAPIRTQFIRKQESISTPTEEQPKIGPVFAATSWSQVNNSSKPILSPSVTLDPSLPVTLTEAEATAILFEIISNAPDKKIQLKQLGLEFAKHFHGNKFFDCTGLSIKKFLNKHTDENVFNRIDFDVQGSEAVQLVSRNVVERPVQNVYAKDYMRQAWGPRDGDVVAKAKEKRLMSDIEGVLSTCEALCQNVETCDVVDFFMYNSLLSDASDSVDDLKQQCATIPNVLDVASMVSDFIALMLKKVCVELRNDLSCKDEAMKCLSEECLKVKSRLVLK
ncbi:CYP76M6 [Acrasis kona]|uniref:CYP76M6 n=1 Tax=Acrasis kona TaxID=1008807 RepID=A0AAW2ZJ61_9EUKA